MKTIRALPLKIPDNNANLPIPERLVVRGECFIRTKDFEQLNKELAKIGEKTYQNPRNTAAGSLRQLDSAITRERPLTLLTYTIVESSGPTIASQWEVLEFLKTAGFPVSDLARKKNNFKEVIKDVPEWMTTRDEIGRAQV